MNTAARTRAATELGWLHIQPICGQFVATQPDMLD